MGNIKYEYYYITDKTGNSNCVVRSLCKLLDKEYDEVSSTLSTIAKELNMNPNDIEVFEKYMFDNNLVDIGYKEESLIRNLDLKDGKYIVFCYDKKEFYHMVPIINGVMYDRLEDSLNLYVINVYREKSN